MSLTLPGRVLRPERMDTEVVGDADMARCLRDLSRVNRASLGYRPTLDWLDRIARGRRHLSILDVGAGHGDTLRRIARWAARRRIEVDLVGIDINPAATRIATAATDPALGIRYETCDLFAWPSARRVDVVISALFAHHLTDADLLRFVRWMENRARLGWYVNDLHRHPVSRHGLATIFRLLPVHRFVRHDGPVSVSRAFVRSDLTALCAAAGLVGLEAPTIDWWFPFRWGVGRIRPDAILHD